ncbi:Sideroflexin-5, partial [Nowakowskiella sp. JEL0078]
MDMTETATAYSMAVATSCTLAVGLSAALRQSQPRISVATYALLSKAVPFAAVAAAGTANVVLMRRKELVDGIEVYDHSGEALGKSTAAGKMAVGQVAVSRVATAFPAVFLPGLVMTQVERWKWVNRNPGAGILINLITITASLMAALPCAVAIYPQQATMNVKSVESGLREKLIEKGVNM